MIFVFIIHVVTKIALNDSSSGQRDLLFLHI